MNSIEIKRIGLDALIQTLGRVNAIRFLQMFNASKGNSVKEKHERDVVYDSMGITVDDIIADIANI